MTARAMGVRVKHSILIAMVVASLVAACGDAATATVPLDLHVENGTTEAITVLVDGREVGTVGPGTSTTIPAANLPSGDWTVEARLPGGRTILEGPVAPSVVQRTTQPDGHFSGSGSGQRVDLSCGRLDIWVGLPMIGPAPGPGSPGDCDG